MLVIPFVLDEKRYNYEKITVALQSFILPDNGGRSLTRLLSMDVARSLVRNLVALNIEFVNRYWYKNAFPSCATSVHVCNKSRMSDL